MRVNLFKRVRGFLYRRSKNDSSPLDNNFQGMHGNLDQDHETGIADDISQMFQRNDKIYTTMPQALRDQVYRTSLGFWRLGKKDGSIGQRRIEEEYFFACAKDLNDQLLDFMLKESVPLKTKLESSKVRKAKAEEILRQAEDYRHDVNTREQLYPKQFSSSIGYLYLIIGLLLVLADIPLALMVTEKIFDFERVTFHHIKDLFSIPEGDRCKSIASHVILTLRSNWQLVIMTAGVALSAVYFKVFYDDFLAFPVDKAIRQDKLLTYTNRPTDPDQLRLYEQTKGEELQEMAKKRYYIQLTKTLILAFTICTIIILGIVRAQTEEAISWGNTLMYILLTILFPVIGGILFSLGMGNFHNRYEKNHAEKYVIVKRREHTEAMDHFTTCEESLSLFSSYVKRCEENIIGDNLKKLFFHWYLHGYRSGVLTTNVDLDLYDRAREFQNRWLALRLNNTLNNLHAV